MERVNRTLVMAFKAYVNPTHTNSQTKIPNSTLAVNTTKQISTEVTLFEVVYERQLKFPIERQFLWPSTNNESFWHFQNRIAWKTNYLTEEHEKNVR